MTQKTKFPRNISAKREQFTGDRTGAAMLVTADGKIIGYKPYPTIIYSSALNQEDDKLKS